MIATAEPISTRRRLGSLWSGLDGLWYPRGGDDAVEDWSGNHYTGSKNTSTIIQTGTPYGPGWDFPGTSTSRIDVSAPPLTGDLTYLTICKPSSGNKSILSQFLSTSATPYLIMQSSSTPVLLVRRRDNSSFQVSAVGTTTIIDGAWHCLALVIRGNTIEGWVDGRLDATNTSANLTNPATFDSVALGNDSPSFGPSGFSGVMALAARWRRALTASEIRNIGRNAVRAFTSCPSIIELLPITAAPPPPATTLSLDAASILSSSLSQIPTSRSRLLAQTTVTPVIE